VNAFTINYNTEYNSTVRTTMSNGKKFDIRQKGDLVSVLYTRSIKDYKTVALSDVPTDVDAKEGNNISESGPPSSLPVSTASSPKASTRSAILKHAITFQG
jgi:hypothetical protein